MTIVDEGWISIERESDIIFARKIAREKSGDLKFSLTDTTRIVTAVSELARNIYHYAGNGKMIWEILEHNGRTGLCLTFIDNGPGIENIEQAMQVGFSTWRGLGMGLPGAKKLMDEFDIESKSGEGTRVRICKWVRV